MTTKQIEVFEELLNDTSFKGRKQLKHLLWLNTSKPKFEIGECFEVTDRGHYIYGYPVRNFKAQITKISSWRDSEDWFYELTMEVECNGKKTTSNVHKYESDLIYAKKCANNQNILGEAKDDCPDALEI